jgi:ABC-type nitrate/sulfonate/bicarbonate transport system substrate-binding protein
MQPRWGWVRKPRNRVTVVYVHGFLSSTVDAWHHPNGAFWPKIFCDDPELEDFGVYLFDYRTEATAGTYSVDNVAQLMRARFGLDDVLDAENSGRALIFVCHSMGGIVARRFIVDRQLDLLNTPLGLFLIASPSLGSIYANFAKAIAPIYNAQLEILKAGETNQWLSALDTQFMNLKYDVRLKIFGQELLEDNFIPDSGLLSRLKLVKPSTANRYFANAQKIAYSDHSSICKPETAGSIQHELLSDFMRDPKHIVRDKSGPRTKVDNPVLIDWPAPPSPPPPPLIPDAVRRAALVTLGIGVGVGVPAYGALNAYRWWTKPTKMRIGMKPFVGYAPLFIAREMGLCPGVDLDFDNLAVQANMMTRVQKGDLDVGMWLACNHALYRSAVDVDEKRTAKATVVLKLSDSYLGDVVFMRGTGQMKDLKGKIALQMNDAGEYLVRSMCKAQGFDYSSLRGRIDDVEPEDAAKRFINREYDMVTTYEPYITDIKENPKEEKKLEPVWSAQETRFKTIVDVLAVKDSYLLKNDDAVLSLMKGWYAAVDLLAKKDRKAIDIAANALNVKADSLKADLDPTVLKLSDKNDNKDYFAPRNGSSKFVDHYLDGRDTFDPPRKPGFVAADVYDKFHRYK